MEIARQCASVKPFPSDHRVTRLATYGSTVGRYLQSTRHRLLGQHLDFLVTTDAPKPSLSFRLFIETLYRHLHRKAGYDAQVWCDRLRALPVIQQADHANLLIDHETLMNNVLFALGARRAGAPGVITIQCSSVSCIARRNPHKGPPFLRTRNGSYNVFGLTTRTYARAAFCELTGPVTTKFLPLSTSASLSNDPLLGPLHGGTWAGPLECFEAINGKLWNALGGMHMPDLLILDDRFSFELVATHLETKTSPIYRLVFDPEMTRAYTAIRQALSRLPAASGVTATEPDFFWERSGRRFEPITTDPSQASTIVVTPATNGRSAFAIEKSKLPSLIRTRNFIPNKMLIYLARCLLPGIRAIGGTSQQDYLSHYRRLLLGLQEQTNLLDTDDLLNVLRDDLNELGGAPLIEPDRDLINTVAFASKTTDWDAALARFLSKPLCETVGTLSCADYLIEKSRNRRHD